MTVLATERPRFRAMTVQLNLQYKLSGQNDVVVHKLPQLAIQ